VAGPASRSRASARAWWLGALVAVPTLLAGLALLWPGPQLAADLEQRARTALDGVGLGVVAVTVTGRDAELHAVPPGSEAVAAGAVGAVPGVRSVRVEGAGAPTTSTAPSGSAPTAALPPEPDADAPGELDTAARQQLTDRLVALLGPAPITFRADSAALAGEPAVTVQRVAALLRDVPAAPIEVVGHVADTPGAPEAAQALSEQRALAVADALAAAGVDRSRITTVGRADHEPLATRAASRRAEIRIG
jgi:outer membrane protein OmpA-like peptidoglycan-associated protein